jgi:hypothetical protein
MTEQNKPSSNEPERKGGGESPATQPSRGDKDSHMTESPKESNRPSGGNNPGGVAPSQNPGSKNS